MGTTRAIVATTAVVADAVSDRVYSPARRRLSFMIRSGALALDGRADIFLTVYGLRLKYSVFQTADAMASRFFDANAIEVR